MPQSGLKSVRFYLTTTEVLKFIGMVVEVTGDVTEEDGVKVIDVKSFKAKEE